MTPLRKAKHYSHFLLAPPPFLAAEHRTTTYEKVTLKFPEKVEFLRGVAACSNLGNQRDFALQICSSSIAASHTFCRVNHQIKLRNSVSSSIDIEVSSSFV